VIKKATVIIVLGVLLVFVASNWSRTVGSRGVAAPQAAADMGGKLVYAREGSIWMLHQGKAQQLTEGPKDENDKRDKFPSISPDGTEIVYTRMDEGFSDLYKLSIARPSDTEALTDYRPQGVEVGQVGVPGVLDGYNTLALWANYPAWSPDGELIAFTSDVGTEYPSLRVIGPNGEDPAKMGGGIDFSQQTVERPSWAPDGSRIAVAAYVTAGAIGQIWTLNLETGRWTELTDTENGAYDPAWSPDGQWIAFTMRQGVNHDVYVIPTDPTLWEEDQPTPVKLTNTGLSRSPVWSPDGSKLAYISLQGTQFDIFAGAFEVSTTGKPLLESPQQLTEHANVDATSGLSWGP
jgi:TolB protein